MRLGHAKAYALGLLPEHKFPACREDFVAAYESLIHEYGISPEKVIFAGDSAGGMCV